MTDFRVLDAHPSLKKHVTDLTPDRGADLVIEGDVGDDRIKYDESKADIVQLCPPAKEQPTFWFFGCSRRGERPQSPPPGLCPICLPAIRQSGQHYFVIEILQFLLVILANPFAYAPRCITWAAVEDLDQSISGSLWPIVLRAMLFLCDALVSDIIGFNALVGNSLSHLHFVSHRPPAGIGLYPLQRSALMLSDLERAGAARVGSELGYPLEAWRFGFPDLSDTVAAAFALIERWQELNPMFNSVNVAAAMEDGVAVLYVIPRSRLLRPWGWSDMPAVVESLGVFVSGRSETISSVRLGEWDYNHFWRVLASLRPSGVEGLTLR
jgi:hypothetical protein